MKISGCFLNTSASASSSFLLYTAPDGLQGEEKRNAFVLGVMAASSCAGRDLESGFQGSMHFHHFPAGNFHQFGIRYPVRRWNDHFFPVIHQGKDCIGQGLLGAGGCHNIFRLIIEVIISFQFCTNRLPQIQDIPEPACNDSSYRQWLF